MDKEQEPLFLVRYIFNQDGTEWKQYYGKERFRVDGTEEEIQKDVVAKPQPIPTKMDLPKLHCKRCDAKWIPRKSKPPVQCPKCKSPYWNRKRVKK